MGSNDTIGRTLAKVARQAKDELLDDWVATQLATETFRPELIDEGKARAESAELLDTFLDAAEQGDLQDVRSDRWQPVRSFLDRFSRSRAERGFSPSETATFLLTLKQPLISHLRRELPSEDQVEVVWAVTQALDQLGLYITQIYQHSRDAIIARQQAEMIELSTPVIKLWEGVLALPLIGTLDTGRSQMLTEALLNTIAATGARVAIIDLTGVPAVDTRMAQHLLSTAAAARLMGSECILSGIRPQIAQTMVHLQIDVGAIRTEADLASALKLALRRIGLKVVPEEAYE